MKWDLVDREDLLGEFLDEQDEVEDLKSVEIVFDDGAPTAILVELTDGSLINFCSRQVDPNGCHERLNVTTMKGSK